MGDEEGTFWHWWSEISMMFDLEISISAVEIELL
jgi:hypothetical protein